MLFLMDVSHASNLGFLSIYPSGVVTVHEIMVTGQVCQHGRVSLLGALFGTPSVDLIILTTETKPHKDKCQILKKENFVWLPFRDLFLKFFFYLKKNIFRDPIWTISNSPSLHIGLFFLESDSKLDFLSISRTGMVIVWEICSEIVLSSDLWVSSNSRSGAIKASVGAPPFGEGMH